jgi:hypothetical protein
MFELVRDKNYHAANYYLYYSLVRCTAVKNILVSIYLVFYNTYIQAFAVTCEKPQQDNRPSIIFLKLFLCLTN